MVGFFRERNSFHVIILVLVTALAKLAYLLHPPQLIYQAGQGLLPAVLNRWYAGGASFNLSVFIALFINLGSALYGNSVMMRQRMFPKTSFIVAVSMVLMSSLVPAANLITAPLLLLPLLIFIYQQLASLYNTSKPRTTIYNIGLAAGIGTILYHPFAIFVVAIMGGIASMRTFRIQEWLILILGLITPYYLYFSWQFLRGYWFPQEHIPVFRLSVQQIPKDVYSLIAGGMILLWAITGIVAGQTGISRMMIQPRKNWNLLLLLVVLTTVLFFVKTSTAADSFALAVFPFSCFAALAFVFPKKLFWPTLLFWVILLVVILTGLRNAEGKIL